MAPWCECRAETGGEKRNTLLGLSYDNCAGTGERRWSRLQAAVALAITVYFAVAVGVGSQFKETGPPPVKHKLTGNLILNKNFAPMLSPWRLYPGTAFTLARSHGAGVARLEATAPVLFGIYELGIAFPGVREKYELSVWVRGSASVVGKPVVVQLNERVSETIGAPALKVGSATARLSTSWQRLASPGRVRRAGDTLDAYIFVPNDIVLADAIYVKQVRLVRVSRAEAVEK